MINEGKTKNPWSEISSRLYFTSPRRGYSSWGVGLLGVFESMFSVVSDSWGVVELYVASEFVLVVCGRHIGQVSSSNSPFQEQSHVESWKGLSVMWAMVCAGGAIAVWGGGSARGLLPAIWFVAGCEDCLFSACWAGE